MLKLTKKLLPYILGGLGGVVGILVTFLVAQPLGSEVYGRVQYYVSVITTLSLLLSFGIPTYIIRKIVNTQEHKELFSSAILLFNIVSLAILIPYFLFSYFVLSFEKNILNIFLCYIASYFVGLSTIVAGFYLGERKPSLFQLISSFLPKTLLFIVAIVIVKTRPAAEFVTYYLPLYIVAYVFCSLPFMFKKIRFGKMIFSKADYRIIITFCLISVSTTVCSYIVKILQAEFYHNYAILGTMGVSTTVLTASTLFCSIISKLSQPQFAALNKDDKVGQLTHFRRILRLNSNIAIPFAMAICFEAQQILSLLGDSYSPYYIVLIILAVGTLIEVLAGPVNVFLSMTGREKLLLINSVINLVVLCLLCWLLSYMTEYGAAISFTISAFLISLTNLIELTIIYRTLAIDWKTALSILIKGVISCGAFAVASVITSKALWVVINILFGISLIGLFFLITPFKEDRIEIIDNFIKSVFNKISSYFRKESTASERFKKVFNYSYLALFLLMIVNVIFMGADKYPLSFTIFGVNITPRIIICILLFAFSLISVLFINKNQKLINGPLCIFASIVFIMSVLSFLVGGAMNNYSLAFTDFKTVFLVIVILPIVDIISLNLTSKRFLKIFIISAVTLASIAIIGFRFYLKIAHISAFDITHLFETKYPGSGFSFRKGECVYHPCLMIASIVTPILLYSLIDKNINWKNKILLVISIGINGYALYQSSTRSLIMWIVLSIVIMVIWKEILYLIKVKKETNTIWHKQIFIFSSIFLVVLGALVFIGIKFDLFKNFFSGHEGGDKTRIAFMKEAAGKIFKSPILFGKGFGYTIESANNWHIEMSLLEVLLKQGFVGYAVWMIPLFNLVLSKQYEDRESRFKSSLAILGLYFLSVFNPYLCNIYGFVIIPLAFMLYANVDEKPERVDLLDWLF